MSLLGHVETSQIVVTLQYLDTKEIFKILCLSKQVRSRFFTNLDSFTYYLRLFGTRNQEL